MNASDLLPYIRSIPDFPIPGILFRDITPLLNDEHAFATAVDLIAGAYAGRRIDRVVAIEARGYILGAPVAYKLGAGFVPVRKPGKLPHTKIGEDYALEYGTNTLEMHEDGVSRGDLVLIVDDLLATGGTAAATRALVERAGATVAGMAFLIELAALKGRDKLPGVDVSTFITY